MYKLPPWLIYEKPALSQKARIRSFIEAGPKRRTNLILRPYAKGGKVGNLSALPQLISLMVFLKMEVKRYDPKL